MCIARIFPSSDLVKVHRSRLSSEGRGHVTEEGNGGEQEGSGDGGGGEA